MTAIMLIRSIRDLWGKHLGVTLQECQKSKLRHKLQRSMVQLSSKATIKCPVNYLESLPCNWEAGPNWEAQKKKKKIQVFDLI